MCVSVQCVHVLYLRLTGLRYNLQLFVLSVLLCSFNADRSVLLWRERKQFVVVRATHMCTFTIYNRCCVCSVKLLAHTCKNVLNSKLDHQMAPLCDHSTNTMKAITQELNYNCKFHSNISSLFRQYFELFYLSWESFEIEWVR